MCLCNLRRIESFIHRSDHIIINHNHNNCLMIILQICVKDIINFHIFIYLSTTNTTMRISSECFVLSLLWLYITNCHQLSRIILYLQRTSLDKDRLISGLFHSSNDIELNWLSDFSIHQINQMQTILEEALN